MLITLAAIAVLGAIIIVANFYQAGRFSNRIAINGLFLLVTISIVILGGLVLLTVLASHDPTTINDGLISEPLPVESGIGLFAFSFISGILGTGLIFSRSLRFFVQKYIVRSDGNEKRKHADSVVHTLAILMMLLAIVNTVGGYVIAGGLEGLAEQLTEISATDMLANLLIYILMSILGVGLFIRRNIPRTLKRLGFRLPEKGETGKWLLNGVKHLAIGAIVGFGMFWIQVGLSFVWQLFVSPETLAEQTAASQAMFEALGNSLWLGFLVAFTAGVGEELLFRGALQPIFGNLIVSIFFVMMHSQYILTPASLIILLVSLVFGFLRTYYTTPSAMMAHFVYNFTPFVIITILVNAGFPMEAIIF